MLIFGKEINKQISADGPLPIPPSVWLLRASQCRFVTDYTHRRAQQHIIGYTQAGGNTYEVSGELTIKGHSFKKLVKL